jgi:SAM-dependent methyltransferase
VEALDVQPADRLLEIGCGHGVAVSLVCERLESGHIKAIDRSPKMIAMALQRNARHVAAGRASFEEVSLRDADFGDARFDKVFGVHVPVFLRGDPAAELRVIRDHLAESGRLYLIDQPLDPAAAPAAAERLRAMLERHGFTIDAVLVEPPDLCVTAS